MKKVFLCALVVFCFAALTANAQIEWDVEKFMPVSEIKAGMKGEGYTVFFGTEAEKFEYTIVSIEYNSTPGWDVVWAEGTSENFKRTGVAGGMSGSPCYVDGRLMGAISLGYFNQREKSNLFGITPIELMVKVTDRGMKPNLRYAGAKYFNQNSEYADKGLNMVPSLPTDGEIGMRQSQNNHSMHNPNPGFNPHAYSLRLAIPLSLPSLDPITLKMLEPVLQRSNMIPVQAAGGGGPVKKSPVEEGQIIGTEYVRGDYSAFGFGTITYIDKNKKELLAYGHPADGEGNVNIPLSGGYVHFILPSRARSSKVASATQPIGTLVQDRVPAIAGLVKKLPNTHHYIPVTGKVQTSDKEVRDVNYEVIREPFYTPIFTGMAISNIVNAMEFGFGDNTVNAKATIKLAEHPDLDTRQIVLENINSSSGSPGFNVTRLISGAVADIVTNPFAKLRIDSIDFDIKIQDKRNTAQILTAHLDKNMYRPGEKVTMTLTVRPYLEQPKTLTASITIPKDTPDGIVLLRAMSSSSYRFWQRSRAPGSFSPKNVNQLVKLIQQVEPNMNLVLEISAQRPGLTVQGEEFSDLPISVMSVMNTATRLGERGYTIGTALETNRVETEYIISGSVSMPIAINRNAQ